MNGTIYDEIKKNGDSKKKEKLKFIVAIIATNLLVFLSSHSFLKTDTIPKTPPITSKIFHPHFRTIIVPLTLLIELDPKAIETPITLVNKEKKVLFSKAYIHEEIKTTERDQSAPARFKIEIPEGEVLKLGADNTEAMIAIPEFNQPRKEKKSNTKRESHYEVDL